MTKRVLLNAYNIYIYIYVVNLHTIDRYVKILSYKLHKAR